MLSAVLTAILSYLAGSMPSGVIVTRAAGAQDPRGIGSKNIGATNVLRTGRKDLAAATLILDALKGTMPVLIAASFDPGTGPVSLPIIAATGAFLGHLFPIFLGFKGGKGVATFLGCLIGLAWPTALAFALIWLGTAFLTRYSSASALAASASTPVVLALMGRHDAAMLFAVLAAIVWVKHSANIGRLLTGTESKIGRKSSGQTP